MTGGIFDLLVRDQLLNLTRRSISTQIGFKRLINFIIINSFLLIFKGVFRLFFRFSMLALVSVIGIFWLGTFKNIKHLLNIAFDIKDVIEGYTNLTFPVPGSVTPEIKTSWFSKLYGFITKIDYSFITNCIPFRKYIPFISKSKDVIEPYSGKITRISKFEGVEVHYNVKNQKISYDNNDFLDVPVIHDVLTNSPIGLIETSVELMQRYPFLDFLSYLFNEFNLFI